MIAKNMIQMSFCISRVTSDLNGNSHAVKELNIEDFLKKVGQLEPSIDIENDMSSSNESINLTVTDLWFSLFIHGQLSWKTYKQN